MTVGHLCKHCTTIPDDIRKRLLFLKDQKSSDGGGKHYWADGASSLGVIETPDGLFFRTPPPPPLPLPQLVHHHHPIARMTAPPQSQSL
jgi:hypothetical protein